MDNPHWLISALVGALAGLVLPYLGSLAVWGVRRLRTHPIEGIWHCYYFSHEMGRPVIKEEEWNIKKGIRHKYVVLAITKSEPSGLTFKGFLVFEKGSVVVYLRGSHHHEETILLRFPYPVAGATGPRVGLAIQHDYDGNAEACVNVLSRDRLDNADVVRLATDRVRSDRGGLTLSSS